VTDPSHDDPLAPNAFTVLRITGVGVPPYSARGLSQSIAPIDAATQLKRTVNGALTDISFSGFKKYKTTISGSDQQPPNVDGIWPGLTVTVDCIAELSFNEGGAPERPAVPGSIATEGAHSTYRPRLTCKIAAFSINHDEYGRQVDWSMDLEEI
jgi:hypothetical protein